LHDEQLMGLLELVRGIIVGISICAWIGFLVAFFVIVRIMLRIIMGDKGKQNRFAKSFHKGFLKGYTDCMKGGSNEGNDNGRR